MLLSFVRALSLALLLSLTPGQPPAGHGAGEAQPERAEAFTIVVNEANPLADLTRDQAARLFLRKVGRWQSGDPVMPVDLPSSSPVREAFSTRVLGRSVSAIRAYWNAQIFSGREPPPPEKASEADVLAFVRSTPSAIGYVARDTELPKGVRAITVKSR